LFVAATADRHYAGADGGTTGNRFKKMRVGFNQWSFGRGTNENNHNGAFFAAGLKMVITPNAWISAIMATALTTFQSRLP
jgi:hypothetical protein